MCLHVLSMMHILHSDEIYRDGNVRSFISGGFEWIRGLLLGSECCWGIFKGKLFQGFEYGCFTFGELTDQSA